jgi:hypothetical protein
MTDPIKRGGGAGPVDPNATEGVTGGGAPRTEGFREALATSETPSSTGASATGAASELGHLAKQLESGSVTPEQAIEALVERQLDSPAARMLAPAQRAELESMLRSRLAEDPTLIALGRDLSRGR